MKNLVLTPANLVPAFQKKIPDKPKFFHFDGIPASAFHEAETIVFKQEGKPDVVIKDLYGVFQKKA